MAKRTDRWRGREVREGGSRSPRGRTRVTTTRIRDTRVFCARTRYTYGAAQHGRVHRSARARCSVDRGRACVCMCVCARARAYMRVGNVRASASVVIRRSYGGGIMSSRFCVGKTEASSQSDFSKIYGVGYIISATLLFSFYSENRLIMGDTRIVVHVSRSRARHLYEFFRGERNVRKIDANTRK